MDKSCEKCGCACGRLSSCALGFASAFVWGLFILGLGVLAHFTQHGDPWVILFSNIYIGYAPTVKGIFFGVIWAVVDGYITGFLLAWVYNFVAKHCTCKRCNPQGSPLTS